MSRIFERKLSGPVTRAFVIGVGAYPFAKRTNRPHRWTHDDIADLPSIATGAALFTDWLVSAADILAAPLASIDLLLNVSDGKTTVSSYSWHTRMAVPPGAADPRRSSRVGKPDTRTVKKVGMRWVTDLGQGTGNQAIFYVCGHGAVKNTDSLVFLTDLNGDRANRWGAVVNVHHHARAFERMGSLKSAVFLVDACGVKFEYGEPGTAAQFADYDPRATRRRNVTVLGAAAEGELAYEGDLPKASAGTGQSPVRAGRFTQCVIQALEGAAVRDSTGRGTWSVQQNVLYCDIMALYELRGDWTDREFKPLDPMMSPHPFPIVHFASPPAVPLRVQLTPPQEDNWELAIHDFKDVPLDTRPEGPATDWRTSVPASINPHILRGRSAKSRKSAECNISVGHGVYTQRLQVE